MPLAEEKEKFLVVAKRILKTDLSTDPNQLIKYKNDIIEAYIAFVTYCKNKSATNLEPAQRTLVIDAVSYIAKKFIAIYSVFRTSKLYL